MASNLRTTKSISSAAHYHIHPVSTPLLPLIRTLMGIMETHLVRVMAEKVNKSAHTIRISNFNFGQLWYGSGDGRIWWRLMRLSCQSQSKYSINWRFFPRTNSYGWHGIKWHANIHISFRHKSPYRLSLDFAHLIFDSHPISSLMGLQFNILLMLHRKIRYPWWLNEQRNSVAYQFWRPISNLPDEKCATASNSSVLNSRLRVITSLPMFAFQFFEA